MMDKTNPHYESVYLPNLNDLRNQLLKSDRKKANNKNDKDFEWISIEEKSLIQLILESFVDPQKKKILNLTSDRTLTAPEILEICEIPTTAGYRKINSLKKNGLLVKTFNGDIKNGKRICHYRSIFENVKIKIDKDKASVNAKFAKA
jgi:hypothetical protein